MRTTASFSRFASTTAAIPWRWSFSASCLSTRDLILGEGLLWATGDNRWEPHLNPRQKKKKRRERERKKGGKRKEKKREIATIAYGYGFRIQLLDDIFMAVKDKQATPRELTHKSGCMWEAVCRSFQRSSFNFPSGTFTNVQCSQRGSLSVLGQDEDGRHFVLPSRLFLNLPDK